MRCLSCAYRKKPLNHPACVECRLEHGAGFKKRKKKKKPPLPDLSRLELTATNVNGDDLYVLRTAESKGPRRKDNAVHYDIGCARLRIGIKKGAK